MIFHNLLPLHSLLQHHRHHLNLPIHVIGRRQTPEAAPSTGCYPPSPVRVDPLPIPVRRYKLSSLALNRRYSIQFWLAGLLSSPQKAVAGDGSLTEGKTVLRQNRKNQAFTLVEILIVVVILGILAAIIIPRFANASKDARRASLSSQLGAVRAQIQLYTIEHGDQRPPN